MKKRADLKALMCFNNVVSINMLRLRGRVQQLAPGYSPLPHLTKQERMRRVVIRKRTGGFCRG